MKECTLKSGLFHKGTVMAEAAILGDGPVVFADVLKY